MPVRIYDISKKLGLENKEVLAKAKELGIAAARVASSTLDKITAEYLEEQLILLHPRPVAPPPAAPTPTAPTEPAPATPTIETPAAPAPAPTPVTIEPIQLIRTPAAPEPQPCECATAVPQGCSKPGACIPWEEKLKEIPIIRGNALGAYQKPADAVSRRCGELRFSMSSAQMLRRSFSENWRASSRLKPEVRTQNSSPP